MMNLYSLNSSLRWFTGLKLGALTHLWSRIEAIGHVSWAQPVLCCSAPLKGLSTAHLVKKYEFI